VKADVESRPCVQTPFTTKFPYKRGNPPLMENLFFEKPILNSPYEYPSRHWELDNDGLGVNDTPDMAMEG
jgi:hypothetical protein